MKGTATATATATDGQLKPPLAEENREQEWILTSFSTEITDSTLISIPDNFQSLGVIKGF